jgi:hypothetical protein
MIYLHDGKSRVPALTPERRRLKKLLQQGRTMLGVSEPSAQQFQWPFWFVYEVRTPAQLNLGIERDRAKEMPDFLYLRRDVYSSRADVILVSTSAHWRHSLAHEA